MGQGVHTWTRQHLACIHTSPTRQRLAVFRLAGRLVDRYGPRKVLLPCTIFLALVLVSGKFLSGAIWQLYVFFLASGMVSGGAGAMSYTKVVSQWFDRRWGLALSVMMLGMGLGAVILPSVAHQLVAKIGWRLAYSVFGLAILILPVPLVAARLKEKPENMGLLPDGATEVQLSTAVAASDEGLTVREALRTLSFWIMRLRDSFRPQLVCMLASFICPPYRHCDRICSTWLETAAYRKFALRHWASYGASGLWLSAGPFLRTSCCGSSFRVELHSGLRRLGMGHAIWIGSIAAFASWSWSGR